MKKHIKPVSSLVGAALFATGAFFGSSLTAQEVLLSESFETDGLDTRYTVQNPSDDGASDYFARREVGSAGTYGLSGGALDGNWFWGCQDLDGDGQETGDLASDEGRVVFNPINISGYANFTLTAAFAQAANETEFDNAIMAEYRVDGGEWITIGGFRGTYTNSPGRYFEGDASTYPDPSNPRLNRRFTDYSWDIFTSGETMEIRFYLNLNGSNESYYFDNVRLTAQAGLPTLGITASAETVSEDAGAGGFQMDFALSQAAPEGGLTVSIRSSDTNGSELDLPESFVIPAGQTSFNLPVDVLNDGGFDGDELVFLYVSAPGYARDLVTVTVTNVQPKPNILMTEVYATPVEDDLTTDASGDGIVTNTQDEYVEVVNLDSVPHDISGWIMTDDLGPRHFVPEGTVLQPNQAYVVFTGGTPVGLFGGAIVHTASTGNIAPSDRDTMTLLSGSGVVTSLTFDAEIGVLDYSVVLQEETNPESPVVSLFSISGEGGLKFTPGLRNDGSPWAVSNNRVTIEGLPESLAENDGAVTGTLRLESAGSAQIMLQVDGVNSDEVMISPEMPITVTEAGTSFTVTPVNDGVLDGDRDLRLFASGDMIFPDAHLMTITDVATDTYNLIINEALSSIIGTAGDPNNNGIIEEPLDDLFIEIVNDSPDWVNLGDWVLESFSDNNLTGAEESHVFPNPTWLAPQGAVVIIGGGNATELSGSELFGNAIVQVANRGGNGVNLHDYEGNFIILNSPFGYIEDEVFFDSDISDQSMSVVRSP
jgi:hypothetical protein